MKPRKIPLRVCIGCQATKPKKELLRIVRTPEGIITIDKTGKLAGRGAYLCPERSCFDKAVKGRRLEKNLKHSVSREVIDTITRTLDEKNT